MPGPLHDIYLRTVPVFAVARRIGASGADRSMGIMGAVEPKPRLNFEAIQSFGDTETAE
jgi:hypothetical protein